MKAILLLVAIGCFELALGQSRQISGNLKTAANEPVAMASVTIKLGQRVLAFGTSDQNGLYQLAWRDTIDMDRLTLEARHLGYTTVSLPLEADRTRYDMAMEASVIDLAEVEVKSKPRIDLRGDTLTYDVASFTKPEDRTIGDVLKHMPGIEVDDRGAIKYNGKSISNLYIDGDDLLEDGYGIGTKTIPHAMVQGVEVLQRHQPLKVLEGKALSDKVALNLKIKDQAKLALNGQAKVGGGLPRLLDGELNGMLFNKKYKMLNVAKGNNSATDLTTDFDADDYGSGLLSSGTIGNPPLPTRRYYFNRSGSLKMNNLINLRSGLQLKSNVGLLADRNKMDYHSSNALFLSEDTIRYSENQQIVRSPFITDVAFNARINKKEYYFNNTLRLGYSGLKTDATLQNDTLEMAQRLHRRVRDFSNTLEFVPGFKNGNILQVNWQFGHYNRPEMLRIHPGINAGLLNNGTPFDAISQYTEIPTWSHQLAIGYRLPGGGFTQHYSLSTTNEWKQLLTALRLKQLSGTEASYQESADNNLRWQWHALTASANYEMKRKRWEAVLSLPVSWQRAAYNDLANHLNHTGSRVLFNPVLRAEYRTTATDNLSFNYVYNNQLGNITDVYRGAVLTNYRSLMANDGILPTQSAHNFGMRYNFQRNIHMLFMNAGVNYTSAHSNTIASRVVDNNISRTVLLPYRNNVSSFSATAGISKFIFPLGATAGLKGSWNTTRYNQFLNGELLPYNNVSTSISPSIEARFRNGISLIYEGTGTWTTSKLVSGETAARMPDRRIQRYDQSLSLLYTPFRNTFIRLSGRHQYISHPASENVSYLFGDANIRRKLEKWNVDIELDIRNLANIRSYETYSLSANQLGYNRYNLRGRMAILRATFNL